MSRPEPLDVWLHGTRLAEVDEPAPYRRRLRFTDQAIERFGEGSTVLSLALPVTPAPIRDLTGVNRPVSNWLDGLLPEGALRTQVAALIGAATIDLLPLLRTVGMECAGAVQCGWRLGRRSPWLGHGIGSGPDPHHRHHRRRA